MVVKATNTKFLYAVLLAIAGSLTLGEVRLVPFQVSVVPRDLANQVDITINPVAFFEDEAEAVAKVAQLKAEAEAKTRPQ